MLTFIVAVVAFVIGVIFSSKVKAEVKDVETKAEDAVKKL